MTNNYDKAQFDKYGPAYGALFKYFDDNAAAIDAVLEPFGLISDQISLGVFVPVPGQETGND